MALSNSVIVSRFLSAFTHPDAPENQKHRRSAQGSNLYVTFGTPVAAYTHPRTADDFTTAALLTSYQTDIGAVVINNKTKACELWLTDSRYSNTTDRHMSYVRQGVRDHLREVLNDKGADAAAEVERRIFRRVHRPGKYTRYSPEVRNRLFVAARNSLQRVNAHGIHEATRIGAHHDAKHFAVEFVRHIETGFTAMEQELLHTIDTVTACMVNKDIDAARATVAAYVALNRESV